MGRLEPKGSVALETDMSSFEGALVEQFCHIANPRTRVAFCGHHLSDSESVPHVDSDPLSDRCSGCGNLKCPDCDFIEWGQ